MTPSDFRRTFNAVRKRGDHVLMYCEPAKGGEAFIVVGLNGDSAVMHGGHEVPLASLRDHPSIDGWLQEKAAPASEA